MLVRSGARSSAGDTKWRDGGRLFGSQGSRPREEKVACPIVADPLRRGTGRVSATANRTSTVPKFDNPFNQTIYEEP